MKKYKIGEVSKMLNIPPETIRSLERMGLLSPGKKEGSNYCFYDLQDISQILNYKRYRQMGFSSAESIRFLTEGSQTELLRMLEEKGRKAVLLSGGHLLERLYQHRLRGVGFLPQAPPGTGLPGAADQYPAAVGRLRHAIPPLSAAKENCDPKGIPVDVIPMADYGVMNGNKIPGRKAAKA